MNKFYFNNISLRNFVDRDTKIFYTLKIERNPNEIKPKLRAILHIGISKIKYI